MDKLLCWFNFHKWEEKRVIEWNLNPTTAYMNGDVCKCCGELRQSLKELTRGLPQNYTILKDK